MPDHDPLCPWPDPTVLGGECPYCELIVAVRSDERERVAEKGAALMGTNEHLIRADERERIARAVMAPFESLFSGGPDTPCRTTWPDGVECVEVPMTDLRAAFDAAAGPPLFTSQAEFPNGAAWVPVATDVLERFVTQRNEEDIQAIRADEREKIAQAIEAWPDDDDTTTFSETMPWIPQEAAARIARGESR